MAMRRSFKPTNLVINGDFSNGITGWETILDGVYSISANQALYGNSSMRLNPSGTMGYFGADITIPNGNKVYVRTNVFKVNYTSGVANIAVTQKGTFTTLATFSIDNTLPANTWTKFSAIVTAANGGIRFFCGNGGYNYHFDIYYDGFSAIDLTSLFGAGKEPSQAWCDLNIPEWFDSTLSGGSFGGIGGLK